MNKCYNESKHNIHTSVGDFETEARSLFEWLTRVVFETSLPTNICPSLSVKEQRLR
jgi:hypothetical protein